MVLDNLAREKGVTALVDCGVAPGMSNILVGYLAAQLDEVESAEILVGGLPQVRYWPYEYKIVFSGIGTLEAFNTDGLRSLIHTMKIPNMRERTLRFPGHAEKMRMLRETGFFSQEPVEIKGASVRPIDLRVHKKQN